MTVAIVATTTKTGPDLRHVWTIK